MKTFNKLLEEFKQIHTSMGMVEDVKLLYEYATKIRFPRVLELGVLHGNSTRTFACAAYEAGSHITSVDIEQGCLDEVARKLKDDGLAEYVTFVNSDSVKFLMNQPSETWNCIFIDTDHRLTQTLAELFVGHDKLVEGGYMFMHDTNMGEVVTSIEFYKKQFEPTIHRHFDTPAGLDLIIK